MAQILKFFRKHFYDKEDRMINNVRFRVEKLEVDIEQMNRTLCRVRAIISDVSQG